MEKRAKLLLLLKIVFAILGIISGVSIFCSFLAFKNVNAAIWGLLSAVFAAMVLRLHVAYRRNVLLQKFSPSTLRHLKHFGMFGSFASIIAAITYFTLAAVLKQGYKIENDGYMPAGVFTLLTLKWTAFLYCHSKHYEKICTDNGDIRPITKWETH